MPSPEVERQALELFAAAVDLAASEQPGWLDRHCGGDASLRSRVEHMLRADNGGLDLQTAGALAAMPGLSEAPDIRGYRVLNRIGMGGMGDVYEAERADGYFSQRVAIKVARSPFASERLLEQFAIERQTVRAE